MSEELNLVKDLAVILISAGIFTIMRIKGGLLLSIAIVVFMIWQFRRNKWL